MLDSDYAYYTNAFTDSLGTIHLMFIVETYKIQQLINLLHKIFTEDFEPSEHDFIEPLRVYIETKGIDDKYKNKGHLYTMFSRNKDLQKGPNLSYISQLLHQCYKVYKAVLEYSGPKYNND